MIGVVDRTVGGPVTVLALGPLWQGVVLVGVRFAVYGTAIAQYGIGLSVSDNGHESVAAFEAGRSLIERSANLTALHSKPIFRVGHAANLAFGFEVPVYVPVASAPLWVLMAAFVVTGNGNILAGLVTEPERLIRPAMDHGPAARRLRSNGRILEELRLEAEAARV